MRKTLRLAAVLTAAAVALSGMALAEAPAPDLLGTLFQGDTSSAEAMVDHEVRTVSNKDLRLTVNSSVSDRSAALFSVTIDALSERAKEALLEDSFNPFGGGTTLDGSFLYVGSSEPPANEDEMNNPRGGSLNEIDELRTDASRTWCMQMGMPYKGIPVAAQFSFAFHEGDKTPLVLRVPLSPISGKTLTIGATGVCTPSSDSPQGLQATIQDLTVGPFSLRYSATWSGKTAPDYAPILLLMKDGTVRTIQESYTLLGQGGYDTADETHTTTTRVVFNFVLDLSNLSSIVLWGMEYPMDGSAPREIEVDSSLLPFRLPAMDSIGTRSYGIPIRSISVRDLTEALGGTCTWDRATRSATLEYRGVAIVFTEGSTAATVDGKTVELDAAPRIIDGKLCADALLFGQNWRISTVYCEATGTSPDEWAILP